MTDVILNSLVREGFMQKYYPRVMDSILDFSLQASGAVLVRGPKWCGKSTTAE